MEIKSFHPRYLASLRELYLESRLTTFTWLDSQDFKLSDFERDTEGEDIWMVTQSDQVIGFISIWEPDSFIHHLFVRSQWINRGVGSRLIDLAKHRYAELSLKCFVQNHHAISFYHSNGFRIASTVNNDAESYHLMTFNSKNLGD